MGYVDVDKMLSEISETSRQRWRILYSVEAEEHNAEIEKARG